MTVALTLYALASMEGSDSGGCFNPTIGMTVSTFQQLYSSSVEQEYFKYVFVYILGPLTGAIIAGFFMRFVALVTPGVPNPLKTEEKEKTLEKMNLLEKEVDKNAGVVNYSHLRLSN